jgi:hypothetical protein
LTLKLEKHFGVSALGGDILDLQFYWMIDCSVFQTQGKLFGLQREMSLKYWGEKLCPKHQMPPQHLITDVSLFELNPV